MLDLDEPYRLIFNVGVIVVCTLLAGLASGLNLAFFSLNLTSVSSLAMGTDEKQAKRAKKILMVFQNPHWLLVTLLLLNAVAVELMPLSLDDLTGPEVAIPVSVILVLFFGEIIPQSLFVSNAVAVCSFFAYLVYFFMIITAPLTLLIALILDKLIGHRDALFYRRRELRAFLQLQQADGHGGPEEGLGADYSAEGSDDGDGLGGVLEKKELVLMMGALSLSETLVRDAMRTRIDETMCVDINERVTRELVERVFLSGKSRIPVYEGSRDNCTHYFMSKVLILQIYRKEEDAPLVKDLALVPARYIDSDRLLGEAYQILTAQPMHLLFVREPGTDATIGLMSSSDVLERVHSARFIDESDLTNQRPMQVLLKSCWNREARMSVNVRRSRGPMPRVGSSAQVSGGYSLPPSINESRSVRVPAELPPPVAYVPPRPTKEGEASLLAPQNDSLNRNSYGGTSSPK